MRRVAARFLSSKKTSRRIHSDDQDLNTGLAVTAQDRLDTTWHESIAQAKDVSSYLEAGYSSTELLTVKSLARLTANILEKEQERLVTVADRDEFIGELLREHSQQEPATVDVAILASVSLLSTAATTVHLLSLSDGEIQRYLRRICLARRVHQASVVDADYRCAEMLLQIQLAVYGEYQALFSLLRCLSTNPNMLLLNLETIRRALVWTKIRTRLEEHLQSLFEKRYFLKLHRLVESFKAAIELFVNPSIDNLLCILIPKWGCLQVWRPNLERIEKWEQLSCTEFQRSRLEHLFDLDGPDIYSHQGTALRLVEPVCFDRARCGLDQIEQVEQHLNLLSTACGLGTAAIDLFIELCVDGGSSEHCAIFAASVNHGSTAYCRILSLIMRTKNPGVGLVRRLENLSEALSGDIRSLTQPALEMLSVHAWDALLPTLRDAYARFCCQLEQGGGDYLGVRLCKLGLATARAIWLHPRLPPEILSRFHCLPPQAFVDRLFDLLQEMSLPSDPFAQRIRDYLKSTFNVLDGVSVATSALGGIEEELKFWNRCTDSLRRDFARTLSRLQTLEYTVYVSCLHAMLKKEDLFICEMANIILPADRSSCLRFTGYLARRRSLNQLQDDCWLDLLVALMREQDSSYFPIMAESMSFEKWEETAEGFSYLTQSIPSRFPRENWGITLERWSWWTALSHYKKAIAFLLNRQVAPKKFSWIYFPENVDDLRELLDVVQLGDLAEPLERLLVLHLTPNGSNLPVVSACIRGMRSASYLAKGVFKRLLSLDKGNAADRLNDSDLNMLHSMWSSSEALCSQEKATLHLLGQMLGLETRPHNSNAYRLLAKKLILAHQTLLQRARKLELERMALTRRFPSEISTLRERLGIEERNVSRPGGDVPDDLIDVVGRAASGEYELCYPLTHFNDLQRKARGIQNGARYITAHVVLSQKQFCLHNGPTAGISRHRPWRATSSSAPHAVICRTPVTLFTYSLARDIHHYFKNVETCSLQSTYRFILDSIQSTPSTCLLCAASMECKLWKRATCSRVCSIAMRAAPWEIRLHNLLVDPLAADLLISSVYSAAGDNSGLDLLPGCPVPQTLRRTVIDSLPPLESLRTAQNIQDMLQGSDGLGRRRMDLLSWLFLGFRGFITSAPAGYKVPSMPNAKQFLLVNSSQDRELAFNDRYMSSSHSGAVFHGTDPSRLFLILSQGLRNLSGTEYMQNAMVYGRGVYCGDDQRASSCFAKSIGQSWTHSQLHNFNVMLGCELAGYAPPAPMGFHCIADEKRLIVRYVFLLPQNFTPPIRAHVEPAMNIAFASLRSGRN